MPDSAAYALKASNKLQRRDSTKQLFFQNKIAIRSYSNINIFFIIYFNNIAISTNLKHI